MNYTELKGKLQNILSILALGSLVGKNETTRREDKSHPNPSEFLPKVG